MPEPTLARLEPDPEHSDTQSCTSCASFTHVRRTGANTLSTISIYRELLSPGPASERRGRAERLGCCVCCWSQAQTRTSLVIVCARDQQQSQHYHVASLCRTWAEPGGDSGFATHQNEAAGLGFNFRIELESGRQELQQRSCHSQVPTVYASCAGRRTWKVENL